METKSQTHYFTTRKRKDVESIRDILFEELPKVDIIPLPAEGLKSETPRIDNWRYTFVQEKNIIIKYEFILGNGAYIVSLNASKLPEPLYGLLMETLARKSKFIRQNL